MERVYHLLLIGEVAVTDAELISSYANTFGSLHITRTDHADENLKTLKECNYQACIVNLHTELDGGLRFINSAIEHGWRGAVIFLSANGNMVGSWAESDLCYVDAIALDKVTPELLVRSLQCGLANFKIHRLEQDKKDQLEAFKKHVLLLTANAGGYVSMLAHDLRSPLSVIKQFASIMQSGLTGDINAEQQEYLETIVTRADGLNTLIGDLLEVSKLEQTSRGMRRRTIRADELVGQITRALDISMAREEISLSVEVGASVPDLYCDPSKLTKAVATIVLYSCRLTKAGGNISIRVHEDAARQSVVFDVVNDGHQIPTDRLLQLNHELNCGVRNRDCGESRIGLSLYIAKELVRFNLGNIEVRNEAESGSAFSVVAPVYDSLSLLPLYRKRLPQFDRTLDNIAIVCVELDRAVKLKHLNLFDVAIHGAIRSTDLVFQPTSHRWLIVLAMQGDFCESIIARLDGALRESSSAHAGAVNAAFEINFRGAWSIKTSYTEFSAAVKAELSRNNNTTALAS